ncbi:hypothetical protein GDO78_020567 [Eleutherodactylus coqui]|uniref:NADP-dependent oxidoreductase domain-containing protein n=1 Tax=Eleutherodactylus coqui TaxID=57060 RepID=A0A8J6BI80_ELECQ|nr:hypothetical protein GDO78_020567 [Eleutherodactylus coqui]
MTPITVSDVKAADTLDQSLTDCVEEAIKTALDIGYRHVDCAYLYLTEHIMGKVFREKFLDGTLKREDLFYTSKPGEDLWPVDESGAVAFDSADLCQTWEALERCKGAGLVKSIGVCNFNRRLLETILNKPGLKYKPVCNQVECHPYLSQSGLLEFCKSKDIVLTAFGVVGSPRAGGWVDQSVPSLLQNPVLISIGEKYQKSAAQVSIRYTLQRGAVPIVKSYSPERMKQNLPVFDFHLSPEDMKAIDGLNQNLRYWKFVPWEGHPHYHFHKTD